MNNQNYTTAFTVRKSPKEVFAAINNPRGWWSEKIAGTTDKLGAVFKYHFQDLHRCTFKIVELVPNQKVVWQVLDNTFSFIRDKTEWKNNKVCFEISAKGDETELRFTHIGLVPQYECYAVCSDGWGHYIGASLRNLITKGKGEPHGGNAITGSERRLVDKVDS